MADNVAITAGAGTTIAADDVGGVLHQRTKLSLGADGSAADAVGGAGAVGTGVQRVTLASDDPAVTALGGALHGWGFVSIVAPTVTNGAYSAGDIMGALMTFTDCARANDEAFVITGVQVACKAAVTPNLTLYLFNADPTNTTKTDNAAYSLNAADLFKVIASVNLGSTWVDHGTPNTVRSDNLGIVALPVSGGRDIYGLLVDGTGVTLTSTSDIQVRVRGVGV